jgi:murein L,D-transpeptidase YcbB/YkuD
MRTLSVALAALAYGLSLASTAPAQSPAAPGGDLRALAASSGNRDAVRFYEARAFAPAWSPDLEQRLVAALQGAERHGVNAGPLLFQIEGSANPTERDASLTAAALSYADVLAHGAVDPTTFHDIFTLALNRVDLATGLAAALTGGDIGGWLEGLAPQTPEYRALSEAYVELRKAADDDRPPEAPSGRALRPGASDARLPAIVELLRWKGYLPPPPAAPAPSPAAAPFMPPVPTGPLYDAPVAAAIKTLQADNGLAADGIIGPATLLVLNSGPADQARQAALNMERWRWLARNPSGDRIDVNVAAARLDYYRRGEKVWSTRTVVGRPDWQTPALGESFDQLIVNPPWNVPASIAQTEILPKGPAYLARNNMYVTNGRVVQRPGPDAALGLVKFDMQNRYAIYLHDTPSKAAFALDERHRSHGCTRVQDAVAFARRLAEERGKGPEFEAALASGQTQTVRLGEPVAVRLLYLTAYLDGGRVVFTDDAYGRDDILGKALGIDPTGPSTQRAYAEILLGP